MRSIPRNITRSAMLPQRVVCSRSDQRQSRSLLRRRHRLPGAINPRNDFFPTVDDRESVITPPRETSDRPLFPRCQSRMSLPASAILARTEPLQDRYPIRHSAP